MDEDFSYRTTPTAVPAAQQPVSRDEADYSTLKAVYKDLKQCIDDIDKWHAFELEGSLDGNNLSINQQILAHKKAFEIVQPAFEAVERALLEVDQQFIERQRS